MRDTFRTFFSGTTALLCGLGIVAAEACADPVQRSGEAAGAVIDRKSGEEVRFVDFSNWQNVQLQQALLGGDILRTNAIGQLAILFADHTQVRLGRNSALQVKKMGSSEDTVLNLQSGTMWARAQRGGQSLTVETPAAAAAIRGTDWTLTVNGNQTSLIVLEGKIEFKNEFGTVEVREGEAAVASIGQAPRKLLIVNAKDRQQQLYYLSLRSGFTFMPATPLPVDKIRAERSRINGIPEADRTADEWLTLAEVRVAFDGQQAALEALARVRGKRLSRQQQARIDLMDALQAGAQRRYGDAARLFERAGPALDPKRRAIASYGGYFARSLADPNRIEKPPVTVDGPYPAIMQAFTQGFLTDIPTALATIRKAEKRFPGDSSLPAIRALLATLNGDREEVGQAVERALALDPENPLALEARATLRSDFDSDSDGAIADILKSIEIAPGSSDGWNDLGLIYSDRGATRESEEAFLKAIALDPDDPVALANLAILYLDQNRVAEAKTLIDKALEVDPAFDVALVARGRYYIQTGETEKGLDDILRGTTANPSYSQGQTILSAGYYMHGDRDPSAQALDNADRLDKNDPVVSSFRTAVAIDDYDAETAIRSAQDFLHRSRAQGGDYAALSANQDAGSTLNNAFRLQGLDAWGRYYGDAVFDPFSGSAYVDQSVRGQVNPYANSYLFGDSTVDNDNSGKGFSSLIQGLMLDPHMLASPNDRASLLRSPFLDTSLGGGIVSADGQTRKIGELEVQGYSNVPVPVSFLTNLSWTEIPSTGRYTDFGGFSSDTELLSGNGYLTFSPTANDRVVIYGSHDTSTLTIDSLSLADDLGRPLPLLRTRNDHTSATTAGVGLSHTFGYKNVANAAILYSDIDSEVERYFEFELRAPLPVQRRTEWGRQTSYIGAVNHMIGNDEFSVRYGAEAGWIDATQRLAEIDYLGGGTSYDEAATRIDVGRVYIDAIHEIQPNLKAEYALFGSFLNGDTIEVSRAEPRIGIAWAPNDRQWLRAAYMRQGFDTTTPTLSPIGVLGLQPNQFNLNGGGYADTIALEWDAEWTDRFFTSVEYQHQELHDFDVAFPLTALPLADSLTLSRGSVDRAALTTNTVLGGGFGLSTTVALATSRNDDPTALGFGGALPYVPETAGQIALTWVNDAHVKATVSGNYTGRRDGDDSGTDLDGYWTLDASLVWEPLDKAISIEASAYNLLDNEFDVATGIPGWGRSFKGMLKVRF